MRFILDAKNKNMLNQSNFVAEKLAGYPDAPYLCNVFFMV